MSWSFDMIGGNVSYITKSALLLAPVTTKSITMNNLLAVGFCGVTLYILI